MKKFLFFALITVALSSGASPTVSWISSPVMPDSTVLISGEGFTDKAKIEVRRFPDREVTGKVRGIETLRSDSVSINALQISDQSIKFVIPKTFKMGVYAVKLSEGSRSATEIINTPAVRWVQGDNDSYATQGGWVRVVGHALAFKGVECTVMLRRDGLEDLILSPQKMAYQQAEKKGMKGIEGEYCLRVDLPKSIRKGEWEVWVHNGYGGDYSWRNTGTIEIKDAPKWPEEVFTVEGTDQRAIDAALAKARENKGGTVYFPTGIYQAKKSIEVPAFTKLKGAGTGRVEIRWPGSKLKAPPVALIFGKSDFAVEDLTIIQQGRHAAGIMSENGFAQGGGGNVTIKDVVIRLNFVSGVNSRMSTDPVRELLDRGLIGPSGVGCEEPYGRVAAVMLGGDNIRVEHVDVWSTGHPFILDGASGIVKDCIFSAPISGRYWVRSCRRLILENNQIECGGAVAGYGIEYPKNYPFPRKKYTTTGNRNILFIGNRFLKSWKADAEVMTVDSHPDVNRYCGPIEGGEADKVYLPRDHIYVLAAKGIGEAKSRKRIEPEKTYLIVGRINSVRGEKFDQIYIRMYDSAQEIGKELGEWDINVTLRADKRELDYLATWATAGTKMTDFRLGKSFASVTGKDQPSLLFHEDFDYTQDDFKNRRTPWFKGEARFDPKDQKNYGDPSPNAIVDFGGHWDGMPQPSQKAITFDGEGWVSSWRKLPITVDMNETQVTYFSFFLKGSSGRANFGLGAADPKRRPPQDQYHGFAEWAFIAGVGMTPTYKGTIAEGSAWHGSLVLIADGKGRGQYRFLESLEDGVLTVDRPWDIVPDKTSFVIIPRSFSDSIIACNSFEDSGRLQMWGGSFGIIVDGNRFVRSSGLAVMGLEYYGGIMPSWQCKLLNNTRIGFNAAFISGNPSQPFFGGPLAGLGVVRGNRDQAAGANGNVVDCVTEHNSDTYRPESREKVTQRRTNAGFTLAEERVEPGQEGVWLNQEKGLFSRKNHIIKD